MRKFVKDLPWEERKEIGEKQGWKNTAYGNIIVSSITVLIIVIQIFFIWTSDVKFMLPDENATGVLFILELLFSVSFNIIYALLNVGTIINIVIIGLRNNLIELLWRTFIPGQELYWSSWLRRDSKTEYDIMRDEALRGLNNTLLNSQDNDIRVEAFREYNRDLTNIKQAETLERIAKDIEKGNK